MAVRSDWRYMGRERATYIDALVPVDTQPTQDSEDLVVAFFRSRTRVGVFDTEDQRAAGGVELPPS